MEEEESQSDSEDLTSGIMEGGESAATPASRRGFCLAFSVASFKLLYYCKAPSIVVTYVDETAQPSTGS